MKNIFSGLILIGFSSLALAHNCPALIKDIDDRLTTETLSEDAREEILVLRAKGLQQHEAGDHVESMKTLSEAKAMLNKPPANLEGTPE